MALHKQWQSWLLAAFTAAGALLQAPAFAAAQDNPPPKPIFGPRLAPPPVANSNVVNGDRIYNDIIMVRLPKPSLEADVDDDGRAQPAPGQGVRQAGNADGDGLTLYPAANVCNDFNNRALWSSQQSQPTDVWSDHYAGWGAFAADDGGFYHADNVVFALEQVVGPGKKYGADQFSAKLSSSQPYAAGLGSPRIAVPPGANVDVRVKYMIFDHDTSGQDFDWVSLGVKPDAGGPGAVYVNGYRRGEWAELNQSIVSGPSGEIMVLLQGQSPAAVNSNVYFDDVMISVDGTFLGDCTQASAE